MPGQFYTGPTLPGFPGLIPPVETALSSWTHCTRYCRSPSSCWLCIVAGRLSGRSRSLRGNTEVAVGRMEKCKQNEYGLWRDISLLLSNLNSYLLRMNFHFVVLPKCLSLEISIKYLLEILSNQLLLSFVEQLFSGKCS